MPSLPQNQITVQESGTEVRKFFDSYFLQQLTFPSNEIDAVVGFFVKRGFGQEASNSTAITLLTQAKIENVKVFTILDTLKGLTDVELSKVVTEVLNSRRPVTSALGYSQAFRGQTFESRNIRV